MFQMAPIKKPKFACMQEQVVCAVEEVKNGVSANKYGIPRTTIVAKVSGKNPIERKMGTAPKLGTDIEEMLAKWVMGLAVRGFLVTKYNLLTSAQQIGMEMGQAATFPKGNPGKK